MSLASRPRILIGDDHALVAEALKSLLAKEFEVVGVASDGRALLAATEQLKPNLVLVDVGMPNLNGLDAGQRIKRSMPHIKIVYVTMCSDPEIAAEAFRIGASAYLKKTSRGSDLVAAIRSALNGGGEQPLAPEVFTTAENPEEASFVTALTNRQRDVLQLLAEGLSMKEVANVLNVTTRTIAFHKYRLMKLLQIRNDAELVQLAVRNHIVFFNGFLERRPTGPTLVSSRSPNKQRERDRAADYSTVPKAA